MSSRVNCNKSPDIFATDAVNSIDISDESSRHQPPTASPPVAAPPLPMTNPLYPAATPPDLSQQQQEESFFFSAVRKLEERRGSGQDTKIRKEKSPTVPVLMNDAISLATMDEGSEINCMDEKFALKNNVKFIPTDCTATAAGSNSMKLAGQTFEDTMLNVQGSEFPIKWDLGKVVIVTNLGVDVLVGEPGKADNKIVTIPHRKLIETVDSSGKIVKIPYSLGKRNSKILYASCRAVQSRTLYPGHTLAFQVPREFQSLSYVNVSPRRTQTNPWVECRNYKIDKNGDIALENVTDSVIRVVKGDHFADMRDCTEISCEDLHSNAYVKKIL